MALDDRAELEPARERSEDAASAAEPRGAEGVRDGGIAVPDEQRALKRERKPLDKAARAQLGVVRIGQLVLQLGDRAVEPPSAPAASSTSARKAATDSGSRPTARRTSSAFTFPEPSQIEFSGLSRKSRGSCDSST